MQNNVPLLFFAWEVRLADSQNVFGSVDTTGKKLSIIKLYLQMYQKSVGAQSWSRTHYVDAFAGTGEIKTSKKKDKEQNELFEFDEESRAVIQGSTKIALNVEPHFDSYTFIELKKKKIEELRETLVGHQNFHKIKFLQGDANSEVKAFCDTLGSKDRAVVFLDPFGSQVEWDTVATIAATEKIDLWYLFPSGGGIYRQISKDGTVHFTHEDAITRIVGTQDWKTEFIKRHESRDLFDDFNITLEKTVDPKSAAEFMKERMRSVFKGKVGDFSIPLGKHAYPSFHLLFASGNPSRSATNLANRISMAAVEAVK